MATQRLSAELQIDAGLGASFTRAFDKLDARVNASTRKLQNIGKDAFDKFSVRNATRQLDRATQQMDGAFMRVFRNFKTRTDTAFSYLKRQMGRGQETLIDVGVRPDARGERRNIDEQVHQYPSVSALRRVPAVFKDTNVQLMEAQENIRGLRKSSKNFEELARHARSMDKAVSPWLRKIDQVNRELAVQERKIDHLRKSRTRLNKAERQFMLLQGAAFGALGAAATGGYALARGAEAYSNLNQVFRVLEAEGVAETDIPLIREQVFRLAETTQFTDVEIANVLVGMKKDGQAVTAELTGVSDILKLAVAESRSLEAAWDATRTLINTTGTDLADAIKLQEQLSNATSVSALNMEQLQYIAGQSLSIYKGIAAFDPADFLAVSGALGDILRPERISTGLREFALTVADAAAGNLSAPRQEAFDLLNLNITDEEGKLKDAVSILQEFEQAFNRPAFLDKQGQLIGDKVQPISAQIFGREALPTVANLLFKSEQIAKNIEAINTPGTLERKSSVMEQSIDAAVNRLKSAVSVLSQRFFEALDGDGNFNRIVDGMSAKVQQLSAWLTENRAAIEAAFKSFLSVAGQIASAGAAVFGKLFAYLREHGPQIRAFFADFWRDGQEVWNTLKPVVMGVLTLLRETFEVVSRLAGGNTKLLAWLASAYVGWKALQTPILAVNAGYNSVLGTVHKLSAAYAGMRTPALPAPPIIKGAAPAPVVQTRMSSVGPRTQKVTGKGKINKLRSLFSSPVVFLGKIRPLLARIGRLLAPILLKVAALGPAFAKVGTFIAPLVTKIVSIGPAFAKVGAFISSIGPAILAVLGGITAPVAAVLAAVVAVVAGGVALIVANWDKAKAAFWSTVETIKLVGQVIWEGLQWVGRNILSFFMNTGPNVQRVVSAVGTHFVSTFKGIGDWLIQYLGPVGQFVVNVFSSIGQGVAWAATDLWNGLKSVGLHIGRFFKSVFGGIVNGIVSMVQWLKRKVGDFFEWVVRINEKVQGVLRKIRDFFGKSSKEQSIAAKTELKEVHSIDLDAALKPTIPRQVVPADVQFTSIPGWETAQEFYLRAPELPERRKSNELRSSDFLLGEVAVQTPPELKMPPMPELHTPQTPELVMPAAPELQTPAAPILQTPPAPELQTPPMPELQTRYFSVPPQTDSLRYEEPTTVEYVDFASVDEIDKTLKAGFKSLLHVNSAMLDAIKGKNFTNMLQESGVADRVSVNLSEKTEKFEAIQVKREVFEKEIVSPVVSVPDMPDRRDIDEPVHKYSASPVVSVPETEAIRFDAPIVSAPELDSIKVDAPTVTMPEIERIKIDAPIVSAPELERIKIDAPTATMPEMDAPTLTMPEIERIKIDAPIVSAPELERIKIDAPTATMPEMDAPTLTMPEIDSIRVDAPVVSAPELERIKIDAPTVTIPEMEDIGMDAPTVTIPEMDSPVVEMPDMEDIRFDAHEETNDFLKGSPYYEPALVPILPDKSEKQSLSASEQGHVEITNNITIHQQPGEDAEMLTARILRELERKHRTEAYQ